MKSVKTPPTTESSKRREELANSFSQDWGIVRVWSSDQLNVRKYELDTIYDINDLFDFWEVLDAKEEMQGIQELEYAAEAARIKAENQQAAGRR